MTWKNWKAIGLLEESLGLAFLSSQGATTLSSPHGPIIQEAVFTQAEYQHYHHVSTVKPLSPKHFFSGGLEDVFSCGLRKLSENSLGCDLKVDLRFAEVEQ